MSDGLREQLAKAGVPESDIEEAAKKGELGLLAIDYLLLPGAPKYSRAEVAERTGIDIELQTRLWRALGFPDVANDEVFFTDDDVEVLRAVCHFIEQGLADEEVAVQVGRVIGSSMARIADAQLTVVQERLAAGGVTGDEAVELSLALFNTVKPDWDRFFGYAHLRHLQAMAKRAPFVHEDGRAGGLSLAVGFADLVGFTALSQQLDAHELTRVVDAFEAVAYDTVAAQGGRVVKMIGDEVMFVTEDPASAARIGLRLAEAYAEDETLSDVRVGIAHGPVVAHEGDYFGAVVNLASRIVNIAYAGSVVVSEDVHDALRDDPEFGWKPIRPRRLKGIGLTAFWAVTRPGEGRPLASSVASRVRQHRNRGRRAT